MSPRRCAVAEGLYGLQPLAGTRASDVNHDQDMRSTGAEHLEDLGEQKKLATYLMHHLPAVRDLDLMGPHDDLPGRENLRRSIVANVRGAVPHPALHPLPHRL